MTADLRTYLAHVELPNPVLTASGCGGTGRELAQFSDVHRLGAFVTRSITMAPRAGRPTPRMAETPSGLLNAVGLQGPGVEAFLERELPWLAERGARTVVSIGGGTVTEYTALARRLAGVDGITAVEINLSCPNVEDRGRVFARDGAAAAEVVAS
ncbi:dihydroorotate dehydrogenase, partial [Microbispora rosea]